MKTRHNKKRNTAFLYETLVRELSKAVIHHNAVVQRKVTAILKEGFYSGSPLFSELQMYRALLDEDPVDQKVASKILEETKRSHARLNRKRIFDSQTKLISRINKELSSGVWSNFVPNYKSLATIDFIFKDLNSIKQKVLFEERILTRMISQESEAVEILEPVDNIVYRTFVEKFNDEYKSLLEEQKQLLGKFVSSFADNGLELKLYLNEEVGRLKQTLRKSLELEEIQGDGAMSEKTKKVIAILEGYGDKKPTENMVRTVLKIQELAQEVLSDD
jgi:hypothetical protein